MKNWKVFKIYGEDSCDVYRMIVPSPTKKEAENFVRSCGLEVVKTTELEDFWLNTNMIVSVLEREGFGKDECDVVMRLINAVGFGR